MDAANEKLIAGFDPASLCYSLVESGKAAIVTDFRQDGDGLTRILVLDRGMSPARTARLSQRLIEIETYRTLAHARPAAGAVAVGAAAAASRTGWPRLTRADARRRDSATARRCSPN